MPRDALGYLARALGQIDPEIQVIRHGLLRASAAEARQDLIAGYAAAVITDAWDVEACGPAQLVVTVGRAEPGELLAEAGVDQFVSYLPGRGWEGLRIWDRMGWAFEERDWVGPPCPCESLRCEWAFLGASEPQLIVVR